MKNSQKGFIVPLLLVVIALLVVGGGAYVYKNKKAEVPIVIDTGTKQIDQNQQKIDTQTPPVVAKEKTPNDGSVLKSPNFSPTKDWSIKYVSLLKQAIKEKYGIDDKIIGENLSIVSVRKGSQIDGWGIPYSREDVASFHFIYKIGWAYYNNRGEQISIKDSSGNDLTDQQFLENIKAKLDPIFTIKNIISEKEAIAKCGETSKPLFPPIEAPWYNNDNNISFYPPSNDLIFSCNKTISMKENRCLYEKFSLLTGAKLSSQEGACWLQ